MRFFRQFLIGFLALTGAVALCTGFLGIEFSHANFWDYHSFLFLLFITVFPRLTLLLSGLATGGIVWWLSWIFAPRILVAVLATLSYWYANPVLVVISWIIAVGGESSEKYAVVRRSHHYYGRQKGYSSAKWVDSEVRKQNQ